MILKLNTMKNIFLQELINNNVAHSIRNAGWYDAAFFYQAVFPHGNERQMYLNAIRHYRSVENENNVANASRTFAAFFKIKNNNE